MSQKADRYTKVENMTLLTRDTPINNFIVLIKTRCTLIYC